MSPWDNLFSILSSESGALLVLMLGEDNIGVKKYPGSVARACVQAGVWACVGVCVCVRNLEVVSYCPPKRIFSLNL